MNFLDQINEKPKMFKFDVQPYLQSSLKNLLKKSSQEAIDDNEETPRKYFEFDFMDKRSIEFSPYFKKSHRDSFNDPSVFNDGSVPADQIISKFRLNPKLILTPQDVDKNFELEKIFKELHFDEHEDFESAPEIPFYKTEKVDDETAEIDVLP